MKIEGSGSISQRHGSADPDPDPPQNVMDPEHWLAAWYSPATLRSRAGWTSCSVRACGPPGRAAAALCARWISLHTNGLYSTKASVNETGSRDRIKNFWQKWVVLGLTKNLIFGFRRCFSDELLQLPFSQRLKWNNNYWRPLWNHCITFSNIGPECPRLDSKRFLLTGKTYSKAAQKCWRFSEVLV